MNEHDLLSIKDFAALTGIKQSTLRHYDEVKLFQPVMRGKNGYRYYSAPQAVAVNFINVMNNMGVPLRKISEIQEDRTPDLMLDLLRRQEITLNRELYQLQQAYAIIHVYCELIREGMLADEHAVKVKWMEAMPIEFGPENDFSSGTFYNSFFDYLRQMPGNRMDAAYPVGGFYKDLDSLLASPGKPHRFFSYIPSGRSAREAGDYVVAYARGYYGDLGDLP